MNRQWEGKGACPAVEFKSGSSMLNPGDALHEALEK